MMRMVESVETLAKDMAITNAVARGREHCVRGRGGPPLDPDDYDDESWQEAIRQDAFELNLRVTAISKMYLAKNEIETYALSLKHSEHALQIDDLLSHLALSEPAIGTLIEYSKDDPEDCLGENGNLVITARTRRCT